MAKSTTLQIKIVNCETGEEIIRDATAEEIVQIELDAAEAEAQKSAADAKVTQREAILDRLGLTADELQTILG
jgi:hypothetical protein